MNKYHFKMIWNKNIWALFVSALKWKLKWRLNFLIHLGLQLLWKISPLKCKIRTEKVIREMGSRKRVLLRHDTICLMVWLSTTNLQERQVAAIFFPSLGFFPRCFSSFFFLLFFIYFSLFFEVGKREIYIFSSNPGVLAARVGFTTAMYVSENEKMKKKKTLIERPPCWLSYMNILRFKMRPSRTHLYKIKNVCPWVHPSVRRSVQKPRFLPVFGHDEFQYWNKGSTYTYTGDTA